VTRILRGLAWAALAVAATTAAWIAVTVVSGDPVTSAYTARQQDVLSGPLRRLEAAWRGTADYRAAARELQTELGDGQPIGRIVIPRIHVDMVVVQGTSERDLEKGPGHYAVTSLPGLGGTVAIAGHRTTWLHPFRHIDQIRTGDSVYLRMPYATFRYVVTGHRVVDAHDWSILRRRPWEKLVLTACHPLFSASERWAVFARLEAVRPETQSGPRGRSAGHGRAPDAAARSIGPGRVADSFEG
jgi:sortase A